MELSTHVSFNRCRECYEISTSFICILLGIVGTLAPCQLTGNISAITLYGNQSLQKRYAWKHILLFILGKIIAFTTLGLLVWF